MRRRISAHDGESSDEVYLAQQQGTSEWWREHSMYRYERENGNSLSKSYLRELFAFDGLFAEIQLSTWRKEASQHHVIDYSLPAKQGKNLSALFLFRLVPATLSSACHFTSACTSTTTPAEQQRCSEQVVAGHENLDGTQNNIEIETGEEMHCRIYSDNAGPPRARGQLPAPSSSISTSAS